MAEQKNRRRYRTFSFDIKEIYSHHLHTWSKHTTYTNIFVCTIILFQSESLECNRISLTRITFGIQVVFNMFYILMEILKYFFVNVKNLLTSKQLIFFFTEKLLRSHK